MSRKERLAKLRAIFRHYGEIDFGAASAWLYAAIALGISDDDEVLALALEVSPGQPAPNLLFAAVHHLLLGGAEHPLRSYYPDLGGERPPDDAAAALFRDFCLSRRALLEPLIRTRLVQTNVLERTGALLPAFAAAAAALGRDELAMVEVGASAGLNLIWDRYAYDYGATAWGDAASPVRLTIEVRGERPLPALPRGLRAGWRAGIDLRPVDLADGDALRWQRALMWPERLDRQRRLEAAAPILRESAPEIVAGDACEELHGLLSRAPGSMGPIVFASYALYQFDEAARTRLLKILRDHGRERALALVTLDTIRAGDAFGTVELKEFSEYAGDARTLARAHPHGSWIEWMADW